MKLKLLIILFLVASSKTFSASIDGAYYWIQFKDKNNSPYSIEQPLEFLSQKSIDRRIRQQIVIDSSDLPVNPNYIQSLKDLGLYVKFTSRWQNGAIIILPSEIKIETIQFPEFVTSYEMRKPSSSSKSIDLKLDKKLEVAPLEYGNSMNQVAMLDGNLLHHYSQAEGITIGILDAGFKNTDIDIAFDVLRNRNGILGTYDFVNPGNNVYNEHYHGTAVLSCITGFLPGQLIGTAPQADVWLLRSEDAASEFPIEEDYWIIAAEFADSVGCDVINSSLGYSMFDDSTMNHSYDELDGRTLRISKAANMAVDKGIVVTSSAGNERNNIWHYILAPAEAESVLGVAAVDSYENSSTFSSIGFPFENVPPKPDVATKGTGVTTTTGDNSIRQLNGTSFSAPLLAGMAACLVKLEPNKTAHEIIHLIRSIGDSFPNHTPEKGYGIPKFEVYLKNNNYLISQNYKEIPFSFNQNTNELNISNISSIKILNSLGQIVKTKKLNSVNSSLNLSTLNKGIYFVILEEDSQAHSFKILKK